MFVKNLLGEFPRESIGIVELETNLTIQNSLMHILQTGDLFIQKLNPLRQRRGKPILFHTDHAFDIILFCQELAKILCIAENLNDCIHRAVKEWLCDPKHTSMADCTTERTTQNVTAPLIRRKDSVHNHDGNRARMICNDFERNILFRIHTIGYTRNLRCVFDDRIEEICLKVCSLVLNDRGKPLQAATSINILVCKEIILPLLRTIILRKHKIPDLEEAVTVTANPTGRFTTATFLTEINVDLRIRTAGTWSDLPEVIFQRNNMIRQHICL